MFSTLIHRVFGKSPAKKASRKGVKVNHRSLHFETLDSRELLAVSVAEFDAIRSQYADMNLSANMADYNVIEITAAEISVAKLKAAITTAGTTAGTTKNDLIVLRTTATQNKITYAAAADQISININATNYGSVTIVSLGDSPLTIDAAQKTRGLYIGSSSTVALAGLTITGGSTSINDGGGIYNFYSCTLTVTNSTISGNTTEISNYYGTSTVTNSIISENSSNGIYNSSSIIMPSVLETDMRFSSQLSICQCYFAESKLRFASRLSPLPTFPKRHKQILFPFHGSIKA